MVVNPGKGQRYLAPVAGGWGSGSGSGFEDSSGGLGDSSYGREEGLDEESEGFELLEEPEEG